VNIFYLGYWGYHDPLTTSTILPHLRILAEMPEVASVFFVSIERKSSAAIPQKLPGSDKVKVIAFHAASKIPLVGMFADMLRYTSDAASIIKQHNISLCIYRGSPAGGLGWMIYRKTSVPYVVESFEPHALYMNETGLWKKWDPRFLLQSFLEQQQKRTAFHLLPAAKNYSIKLQKEGIPISKISVVPCCVDAPKFAFNTLLRAEMRKRLNIAVSTIVGIYVGKFGGVYYDVEAFQIFKKAFEVFTNFHLIILSPEQEDSIRQKLRDMDIDSSRVSYTLAKHDDVPAYLSAADFAFSTILPSEGRKFCSAVKNGEYWAAGLPFLMTEGVGDDDDILLRENAGATFNLLQPQSVERGLHVIDSIIKQQDHRTRIANIAARERNFNTLRTAYKKLIHSLPKSQ
jgi:glycosyltransferase involved in cell wall biosynthesis